MANISLLQHSLQDSGFNERSRRSSAGSSGASSSQPGAAGSSTQGGKENASPNKRARKSLASNWPPQSLCRADDSSFTNPETPSKSLLGTESSLIFTPPSILKDTLDQSDDSGNGDHPSEGNQNSSAGGSMLPVPSSSSAAASSAPGQQQHSSAKTPSHSAGGEAGSSPPKSKVRLNF